MSTRPLAGIILAAGKGTRMKSDLPKVLHPVCGLPMVELVARAMVTAGVERPIIVIGHGGEKIQQALGARYDYVWQHEQKGTGHAAMMAADLLGDFDGDVLVSPGDTPLLRDEVFTELVKGHVGSGSTATVSTALLEDPHGYGRIVRDSAGAVTGIVEHKDATEEQRAIREINSGLFCFDCQTLFRLLPTLRNDNSQGEHYLTDILAAVRAEGRKVVGLPFSDPEILVGVNDRWQLAQADKALRTRILREHAMAGVTLLDLDSIVIGPDVVIGPDTVIEPSTQLLGSTTIGKNCRIGPNSRIKDTVIGDHSTLTVVYTDGATVGDHVWVGPFAHLRPKARLADHVKIGNFVEVKNAALAQGAKANHLAYIGDAEVGRNANIGAGTITCNYDGFEKHRTVIGENAFVGSNSTLVAPVTIGDGAIVAAGSTINKDVPADAAAFGRARQEVKEDWAARWRTVRLSKQ
jgi:bifunctional UDP-N-acetylglucosamine pyrophosphorylase / glucosamine-1-phosphate N-acetyltransferase